jgi:hypothetical protein
VAPLTPLATGGYVKKPGVTPCHMVPADSQTNPSWGRHRAPPSSRHPAQGTGPPGRRPHRLPPSCPACDPSRPHARSVPPGPLRVGTAGLTTRVRGGTNSRRWAAGARPHPRLRRPNLLAHRDLRSSAPAGPRWLVRLRDVVYIRRIACRAALGQCDPLWLPKRRFARSRADLLGPYLQPGEVQ